MIVLQFRARKTGSTGLGQLIKIIHVGFVDATDKERREVFRIGKELLYTNLRRLGIEVLPETEEVEEIPRQLVPGRGHILAENLAKDIFATDSSASSGSISE